MILVLLFVILIGVLIVLIWLQHRRQTPTKPLTAGSCLKTMIILFIFLFALFFVTLSLAQYAYITRPTPSVVERPDELLFSVEDVQFESGDGLVMSGWFTPPQNGATIILLHGMGGNRTDMLWYAEQLTQAGYGVLMYDERASGESEGSHRSYGWEDPTDVQGALTYLNGRSAVDPQKIGIAGCSLGGQIALQSAAIYPELKAVWAGDPSGSRAQDSAFPQRPADAFIKLVKYIQDIELALFLNLEPPAPLIDTIGTIAPRPVTIIASGKSGRFLSAEEIDARHLAQYAGENSALWIIDDAKHCNGHRIVPEQYATKMISFFNAAFNISSESEGQDIHTTLTAQSVLITR